MYYVSLYVLRNVARFKSSWFNCWPFYKELVTHDIIICAHCMYSYKRIFNFINKGIINNDELISESDKYIWSIIIFFINIFICYSSKFTCTLLGSYLIITLLLFWTFILFILFGLIYFSFGTLIFFLCLRFPLYNIFIF